MSDDLRAQLVTDVRRALAAVGGDINEVNRAEIAKKYMSLGVARSSAFRMISRALGISVDAIPPHPRVVAPQHPTHVASARGEEADGLRSIIGPEGAGLSAALEACVKAATDVMRHSRHPDGRIRTAKTLVAASEHLRRCVDTAAKIQKTMASNQKLEQFYDSLGAALTEVAPDVAGRVFCRLQQVNQAWREAAENLH